MEDVLQSKFREYEAAVSNYLALADAYKDSTEASKAAVVESIETASTRTIDLIKRLKRDLIKDTVCHLNQQTQEYEVYESEVTRTFSKVKENVVRASTDPQINKDVLIKLDKAMLALEKPVKRVFSFIEQWDDISKSDIGIVISEAVQESKPAPIVKRAFKKKMEKHADVRMPRLSAMKGLSTSGRSVLSDSQSSVVNATSSVESSIVDEISDIQAPGNGDSVSIDTTADVDVAASIGPSNDEVNLILSAVAEWSIITSQDQTKRPDSNHADRSGTLQSPTTTGAGDNSQMDKVEDENHNDSWTNMRHTNTPTTELLEGTEEWVTVDEINCSNSFSNDVPDVSGDGPEVSHVPSINISFPSLSLGGLSEGVTTADRSGFGDSEMVVKMDKDIRTCSSISRFLASRSSKDVIHAELSTTLGGENLHLNFPIGACVFQDGLIVCNSGDHTVYHIIYNHYGEILHKAALEGSFMRPSAVVVDRERNLFIKDDTCIRRYGSDLKKKATFTACPRRPYGLAVTMDNHLITMADCGNGRGVPRNPCLLKYNTHGELLSIIPLQLPLMSSTKLRFMDISGDHIFISDLGASFVYMTDVKTGKLIKVLAEPGKRAGYFNEPSGITCDRDGNILIADSRSNRIQIFDGKDATYKGMLDCQGGLRRPSGIYLDENDKLYAVNYIAHRINIYDLVV